MIVVGFLFLGIQTGSSLPSNPLAQPIATTGWLYVGGGGPGNYSTIQSAINAASNGDTIFVYSGTYAENIIIDKSITLLGENRTTTTMLGNSVSTTVNITAASVTLNGFTIKNDASQNGIYTSTSSHTFTDDVFTMTSHGIYLYYSSENTILNSSFGDNAHSGIYMQVGQNNTIAQNEFFNNSDEGIYLKGCGVTHVEKNTFNDNGIGLHTFEASSNIIKNNIIQFNGYGIFFEGRFTIHSNFNTITHNRITDNTICGVRIEHSEFNLLEFNEIKENSRGIEFEFTGANIIRNNNITESHQLDIMLTFSVADVVSNNNIDNSQQSLVLLQINFGLSDASFNWWGSIQWPLRRVRPIGGWVIMLPWRMSPLDFSVGPEP